MNRFYCLTPDDFTCKWGVLVGHLRCQWLLIKGVFLLYCRGPKDLASWDNYINFILLMLALEPRSAWIEWTCGDPELIPALVLQNSIRSSRVIQLLLEQWQFPLTLLNCGSTIFCVCVIHSIIWMLPGMQLAILILLIRLKRTITYLVFIAQISAIYTIFQRKKHLAKGKVLKYCHNVTMIYSFYKWFCIEKIVTVKKVFFKRCCKEAYNNPLCDWNLNPLTQEFKYH